MRFLLVLVFVFVFFLQNAFSQISKNDLKPYVEVGMGPATGISRYVYSKFIDPRIGITYQLYEKLGLNADMGYVYFFRKSNKRGVSFLPLSAGIDYMMVSKFFLGMQIGGAFILDGSGEIYFLAEPGIGWKFNKHHIVRLSYYGFVTNSVAIGGINFAYRYVF